MTEETQKTTNKEAQKEEQDTEEKIEEKQAMEEKAKQKQKEEKKIILDSIRPGDTVKVFEIINSSILSSKKTKGKELKDKIQVFEGLVLARKHGRETGATITVRKVVDGIGVEKIFPLLSPMIQKIEIIKKSKIRRAKLYYLREAKGKRARLKTLSLSKRKVGQKNHSKVADKAKKEKAVLENIE